MKNKVMLNNNTPIDLRKLIDSRLLVQANSGGGKSWAIRRLIEQAFGKVQIIVLDPEGEFINLREKFDFVYAGKGGDAPVEPRSAAMLAKKLLELKASAIVDLYELNPQDRKRFVRYFCDAMVNADKKLWHDCLVIIDEAHVFAPEKGESEAMGPVIDLATRGRKRGYSVVLATQRLPKLAKDAAAECNNKLIGRASQDIDRKRASEELGFTTKEQVLSLRDLEPGEFYAFGPAISREVRKIVIGDVAVKPPKRGTVKHGRPPKPTAKIRGILSALKDLPKEAEQELQTTAQLKSEIVNLKREIATIKREGGGIPSHTVEVKIKEVKVPALTEAQIKRLEKSVEPINKALLNIKHPPMFVGAHIIKKEEIRPGKVIRGVDLAHGPDKTVVTRARRHDDGGITVTSVDAVDKVGLCERKVYSFLLANPTRTFTKEQVAGITDYSASSGGFGNALSKLTTLGAIRRDGGVLQIGDTSHYEWQTGSNWEFSAEPEWWADKLPKCEREIYRFVWDRPTEEYVKELVGQQTGYSASSGGFNNALSKLTTLGLILRKGGMIKLNPNP